MNNNHFNLKIRLILMNFLEFAVWGAYLTAMGRYLGNIGLSTEIAWFYSIQGVVSIFMPALIGMIADRFVPAQRLLGICHLLAGTLLIAAALYQQSTPTWSFGIFFTLYTLSVAFYMPTLALTNSVAYTILTRAGMDTVKDFPPIRVFGTIGFICAMWFVDLAGIQADYRQFIASGVLSLALFAYAFTLPACPIIKDGRKKSFAEAFGLNAFALFKRKDMALFLIFSMLLGVSLQITNSFANPFISSFASMPEYAETFGVQHTNIIISISQISETCCILLIPFFLKRFGIKKVMIIAMAAWVFRFGLFGLGNPGPGLWMFILSMLVYGVAFDFFNISGSLYIDRATDDSIRSAAQGLFMLMTNGIGATVGTLGAQWLINKMTHPISHNGNIYTVGDWPTCWFIFAGYALCVLVFFTLMFKERTKSAA